MRRREFNKNMLTMPLAAAAAPAMGWGAETALDTSLLPPGGSMTDVPGIKVGHFTLKERPTGCTVIMCEEGATGGVDVRGLGGIDWSANYRREHPNAADWIAEPVADLSAALPGLAQPVLLIWGGEDPISPVAVGERLASLLPNARLHVVPGAGHDVVERHATELAPLIETFLA